MQLAQRIEETGRVHGGAWSDIAAFLLEPGCDVASLGMAEVAERCFSSKATLVRFAKELGFSGWREFRAAYLEECGQADDAFGNVDVNLPFDETTTTPQLIESVSTIEAGAIRDTVAQLDPAELDRACALILGARRVAAFGASPNNHILQVFMQRMNTIGRHIEVCHVDEGVAHASTLTGDDCAILVSYSGSDGSLFPMRAIPALEERGVPILAITSAGDNFLRSRANVTLTLSSREHIYGKPTNIASITSLACLADLLYARCFREHFRENLARKLEAAQRRERRRRAGAANGFEL